MGFWSNWTIWIQVSPAPLEPAASVTVCASCWNCELQENDLGAPTDSVILNCNGFIHGRKICDLCINQTQLKCYNYDTNTATATEKYLWWWVSVSIFSLAMWKLNLLSSLCPWEYYHYDTMSAVGKILRTPNNTYIYIAIFLSHIQDCKPWCQSWHKMGSGLFFPELVPVFCCICKELPINCNTGVIPPNNV